MTGIPRIRGKVGTIEDPPEWRGQFCFEISMWTLDGETQVGDPIGPFGPYKTEKEAQDALRSATRKACEAVELGVTGQISGKFLDLKNGAVMRPWDEN